MTGDLYSIYESCLNYLQSRLNTAMIPHAHGREERLELPEDALREALVNAIVHRDYRSTANVQVHVYHDRVEIIAPGGLPAGMKEEDLGQKSVPRNPLLFGMFYRMDLVEQVGSGVTRIRDLCREYDVADPQFHVSDDWVTVVFPRTAAPSTREVAREGTSEVTGEVAKLLACVSGEMTRRQLQDALGLRAEENFRQKYLVPALEGGLIERTIPDKPRSRNQRYRLTASGQAALEGQ